MRNPERIDTVLAKFSEMWKLYPDLRFGQLFTIMMEYMPRGDIFFHEEDVWLKAFEDTIKSFKGQKGE